jgi:hypothetical protein
MSLYRTLAKMINDDFVKFIEQNKPLYIYNDIERTMNGDIKDPIYYLELQHLVSYHFPDKKCIDDIIAFAKNDSILEIAAGQALTSALLLASGVDPAKIAVTNEMSNSWNKDKGKDYITTEDLDYLKALDKYPDYNVLMMMWPPHMSSLAVDSLKKFKGDKLIYSGHHKGGATADDDFFDELDSHWELQSSRMNESVFPETTNFIEFYTRK